MGDKRIAIVHDYLTQRGGAERVVLSMLKAFPDARLITSIYDPETTYPEFRKYQVETMWLNKVSTFRRDPRRALPMLASAFASTEVKDVDFVLCSSSGWSHGIRTRAPKVVYCHNPARWLYQTADYTADQSMPVRLMLDVLRKPLTRWDQQARRTATAYLANSWVVRDRILATYGIEADVLPPPVGIDPHGVQEPIPGLYPGFLLTVSRDRGYKNSLAVAEAVNGMRDERLVMVGGLPDPAPGTHWSSRLLGLTKLSDAQLRWLYANCSGLLAVSHEDFGLTPLEANSFGKPVACLRAGGFLDTLRPGLSGVFVESTSSTDIVDAIARLRATRWSSIAIKAHAERYSPATFASRLHTIADEVRTLQPQIQPARVPALQPFPVQAAPAA